MDDVSTQLDDTLLRRELKLLDKTNRQAVGQQKKLSFLVNKLDGELSRTHYCSQTYYPDNQLNESGFGDQSQFMGGEFSSHPKNSAYEQGPAKLNSYKMLKELNKELGKKQVQVQQECSDLAEKVRRMNDNLQKLKYAEANETKGNITANQFNRDVSKIEKMDVFVQQLQQQKEMLKQAYRQTGGLPSHAEQSQISRQLGEQFDARLRKAEQLNLKLSEEHSELKRKLSELETKIKKTKASGGIDDLLSKIVEDGDKSVAFGHGNGRPTDFLNQSLLDLNFGDDQESDLQFRLGVLESDLQQAQTENNRLVETVLNLKKSVREKQSFKAEKLSTEMLLQEINEIKRHIQVQDDEIMKLDADISNSKAKLESLQGNTSMRQSTYEGQGVGMGSFQELKTIELESERKRIEIDGIRQRIESKENQLNRERNRRNNERAQALLRLDRENSEASELKSKINSLKKQLLSLEEAATERAKRQETRQFGGSRSHTWNRMRRE